MHKYPEMQVDMEKAIDLINNMIYKHNREHKVATPFLHGTIRERRGGKTRRYYVYRYKELFVDGLHATTELLSLWGQSISSAMARNDLLEDSDDEGASPKRSWRY